ncbi:MAG: AraC family transcriptional regulator [Subdoligranulum sp.]|nr:AraC family transcriptional regulator [Subdoligranulum sp.]
MYRIISPNRQDYFAKKGGFAMALSACNTETDSAGRELTVHGTAAFPIACYHDDLEAAPVPWHWHEELELLIASEGGVLAAAAGEKYTLAEGDGLFINAGVLHADWPLAVGRCRLHSVVFHPRLVGGSPDSVFWQKYLQPLLTDPSRPCAVLRRSVDWQRETMGCMERAFRAVVNEIPGYEFKTRAALSEMMYLLVTRAPATRAVPKKALRSADRIKTMLQFVQTHYAEDLTVEQIAASASISPSECLRCFHDMIGTTPNQYLRGQRLQRAAELLCGQVTAIAAQCGFEDSSYFARSFRQLYGCGPTEFRRRTLRAGQ